MKSLISIIFCLFSFLVFGQQIQSINSGAVSNNNLIYTVGEIFVNSEDEDESSSGIIGVVSVIEFYVLGTDDLIVSEDFRAFPNPTSQILYFESNQNFNEVYIFDLNGALISHIKVIQQKVNLSNLTKGVYILKTNNPKIKPIKIIKK